MFPKMDENKPYLRELVTALRGKYAYASVLAVADDSRAWQVSRSGSAIGTSGVGGGCGYVLRVFDEVGCAEFSWNELPERVDELVGEVEKRLEAQRRSLPVGVTPLPTPLPPDEPAALCRTSGWKVHPRDLGDEAILAKLREVRERGLKLDGRVLDVSVNMSCRSYRKLFLSEKRDLDQTLLWTNASVIVLCRRGEEIKDYYRPYSTLGGAELLDEVGEDLPEIVRAATELLDSQPIPPGEYECVCDPATTGMIVHEAFGHGVEMDLFVKDRALARKFVGGTVASGLVTMHDGTAIPEAASAWFDDEGTLTGDTTIIEQGTLRGGMCDLLSALRLGVKPTGNGRRESYRRKAYTRMTNTYFAGGESTPEELIASVDYGFLLEDPSSGMEDPKNWGIQCMVTVAREIRGGRLTGKVFSPVVLTGYVPDLLKSVTMMSRTPVLCGSGYCGKGYKEWVKVSDGGPYMKAKIRLG